MRSVYDETYARSLADPAGFWAAAAEDLYWDRRWDRVFDDSRPPFYRWFTGGVLNTCYNALDLHVDRGRGKQRARVYDSPVTDTVRAFTYAELRDAVARMAGALRREGIAKGDRVIIYMPMVPEAVMAMLACARIGAIHSVVFGGFAPNELAKRIDDARPKLIVSASCGIEPGRVVLYKPLLDGAIELSRDKPERCVILQRAQAAAPLVKGRDLDWDDFMAGAPAVECVPVAATDPLYILYTSGTTGIPKGVVRDNGGHAVALKWSMTGVYGMGAGETYWAASDIGWVVGHSYIVYAPLLKGCTTILYEGKPVGTPDPGAFWRLISQHGVNALFTAPTAFRAIKKEDPHGVHMTKHDLSRFRTLFLAGERCDPDGLPADVVEQRCGLRDVVPHEAPGVLSHRRRGLSRRRRLPLHHEPRGRHHQRGGPPALDGRDGRGAGVASRHRRMRGGRRGRRHQGRGAGGLRRHQGGRDAGGCRGRPRAGGEDSPADRAGGGVQDRARRQAAAQDALGQDPARDDEEDRGWAGVRRAGDHRRSRDPRRDRRRAERCGLPEEGLSLQRAD